MRTRLLLSAVLSAGCFSAGAGCSDVAPTNPFDPGTPASQQAAGQLTGVVWDATAACAVEGATVTLRDTDLDVLSDAEGRFTFANVPGGAYTVDVTAEGFRSSVRGGLTVGLGDRVDVGEISLEYERGDLTGQIDLDDCSGDDVRVRVVATRKGGAGCGGATGESVIAFVTLKGDGCEAQTFGFSGLRAVDWELEISAEGYRSARERVAVTPAGETEAPAVTLVVDPGTIQGILALEGGELCVGETSVPIRAAGETTTASCADGHFSVPARAGVHPVEINVGEGARPEYTRLSLPAVAVAAGKVSDLGTLALAYATGEVVVAVRTVDDEAPTGVLVSLIHVDGDPRYGGLTVGGELALAGVRGGTYQLIASKEPEYRSVTQEVEVDFGDTTTVELRLDREEDLLPINPGTVTGLARLEGGGAGALPIYVDDDVEPAGATEVDSGVFSIEVRGGAHTLTIRPGADSASTHDPVVVSGLVVQPGQTTNLGEHTLPYQTGDLGGIVRLADGRNPAGAQVRATRDDTGDLAGPVVIDGDGAWQLSGVRTGTYSVVAERAGYLPQTAREPVNSNELTDVPELLLPVNPGSISGVLGLLDGDPEAALEAAVVVLQDTGEVAGVSPLDEGECPAGLVPCGRFAFEDLAPGVYTVAVSLTDYEALEQAGILVDPGAETEVELALHDRKAPLTPGLELPAQRVLPGFPISPAVVALDAGAPACLDDPEACGAGELCARGYCRPSCAGGCGAEARCVNEVCVPASLPLVLTLDGAASYADANFDPEAGLGEWQWRYRALEWTTASTEADPSGDRLIRFSLESGTYNLQVRPVDAEGNAGTEAELLVTVDDDFGPTAFALRAPPPPAGLRPAGDLRGLVDHCLQRPGPASQECFINADSVNLELERSFDAHFGCYFLAEAEGRRLDDAGFDPASLFEPIEADLDNAECYPLGTQFVTVFPDEGASTLYCVRAYDQALQKTAPACILLTEDSQAPASVLDLFPDQVSVRADEIRVPARFEGCSCPDGPIGCACFDSNFAYFEKREPRPGADFEVTDETDAFTFHLLPGQPNQIAVRPVDRAGNRGETVGVTLYETSVRPLASGVESLASAATVWGTQVIWSSPRGCDPEGESRVCRHDLLLIDESLPEGDPRPLDSLGTCAFECPFVAPQGDPGWADGARKPLLAQGPNGLLWADFIEVGGRYRHVVRYKAFGSDGRPAAADPVVELGAAQSEDAVLQVAVGERMLAFTRYNSATQRYTLYAHPLIEDEVNGRGWLEPDPGQPGQPRQLTLDAAARPTGLGVYENAVFYTTTAGHTWIWTEVGQINGVHARAWLPGVMGAGARVLAASGGRHGIQLLTEADDGAQALHRLPLNWHAVDQRRPVDCFTTPGERLCRRCPQAADTPRCQNNGCFAGTCAEASVTLSLPTCQAQGAPDPACGVVDPTSLTADEGFTAWVAIAERPGGGTEYKLASARFDPLPGQRAPAAGLIARRLHPAGGLHAYEDRVVYLDRVTGADRLYVADSSQQSWLELGEPNPPKAHLQAGTHWLVYSSFQGSADDGLRLVPVRDGVVSGTQRLPRLPQARPGREQTHWQEGRGVAMAGGLLAVAWEREQASGGGLVLTVFDLRAPPQPEGGACGAPGDCPGWQRCQQGACVDRTCAAGCEGYACDADADTCTRWPILAATTLTPIYGALEARDVRLATDGEVIALAAQTVPGIFVIPAGGQRVRIDQANPRACEALGVAAGLVICGRGRPDNELMVWQRESPDWRSTRAANLACSPQQCPAVPGQLTTREVLQEGLSLSGVWVATDRLRPGQSSPGDRDWIVIGTAQSGVERFTRIDAGADRQWGTADDELRRAHARTYDPSEPDAAAELGRASVYLNSLVFSDPGLTRQPEVLRVRVSDLTLNRLTFDDAVQHFPAVGDGGVFYVDHRYTRTAAGAYLPPPAITARALP